MLVETEEEETSPELLTELCANIDDMTPEQTAYLAEKLWRQALWIPGRSPSA